MKMTGIDVLKKAVAEACGALSVTDWEFIASSGTSISASMINDELVEFSSSQDTGITLRLIHEGKEGSVTSDRVDEEIIPMLVRKAYENSLIKEADESYSPEIFHTDEKYPEKNSPSSFSCSAAEMKRVLSATQKALFESDERVAQGTSSDIASSSGESFLENSRGLSLSNSYSSSYIASQVVVKDKDDVKTAFTAKEGDVSSLDMKETVSKALSRLHAGSVSSGVYKIIFSPECFNMFLSAYSSAFSGKNALLGLSPYKDRKGEMIASPSLSIIDDPLYPGYTMQKTYDGDARPTYRKDVVRNGRLETLLYNRQWALKAGCESTGNGAATSAGSVISPYSFYVENGDTSFDDLVKKCGKGIYITAMKGFHAGADPVSGDFSIESSGFMIEDGKITCPVEGFTVAGNFFQLLRDIKDIADDLEFDVTVSTFRTGSPSILVDSLSIAGK